MTVQVWVGKNAVLFEVREHLARRDDSAHPERRWSQSRCLVVIGRRLRVRIIGAMATETRAGVHRVHAPQWRDQASDRRDAPSRYTVHRGEQKPGGDDRRAIRIFSEITKHHTAAALSAAL
jgi:hypothetical protein